MLLHDKYCFKKFPHKKNGVPFFQTKFLARLWQKRFLIFARIGRKRQCRLFARIGRIVRARFLARIGRTMVEWLSAQIKRELRIRANSHYTQSAPIRAKSSGPAIRPNRAMLPDSGEQLWASYLPEFLAKSRVLAIGPNHLVDV